MSKFVLKGKPEEEVKIGDSMSIRLKTPFGTVLTSRIVDESYLNVLVEQGIVVEIPDTLEQEEEITIFHVIEHLAKRLSWKVINLKKYIENLYTISPVAVYQILLKECAIMIDSHYKDHITAAKRLWAVSIVDGQVFEVDLSYPGNYTNVALFRTPTEAKLAKEVLALIEEDIF